MSAPLLSYPENIIPNLHFQFCPICATSLQRKILFDDNILRLTCSECGWIQLSSDVVGVVTVAHCNRGIAAISPPNETGVGLPAGLVEYGESPEEAAIREVLEETGLVAELRCCLGWFFVNLQQWPGPMVQFMFEAEITGGALRDSDEGTAHLFPLSSFPPISTHRTGSQKAMEAYRKKWLDKMEG
jgi:ADP-ribose pyrophosphatase YjhB (NUDIX family)